MSHSKKNSKLRIQNDGLPQKMASIIFNIYTNDQLIRNETKHFIYTDDLAVLTQETSLKLLKIK